MSWLINVWTCPSNAILYGIGMGSQGGRVCRCYVFPAFLLQHQHATLRVHKLRSQKIGRSKPAVRQHFRFRHDRDPATTGRLHLPDTSDGTRARVSTSCQTQRVHTFYLPNDKAACLACSTANAALSCCVCHLGPTCCNPELRVIRIQTTSITGLVAADLSLLTNVHHAPEARHKAQSSRFICHQIKRGSTSHATRPENMAWLGGDGIRTILLQRHASRDGRRRRQGSRNLRPGRKHAGISARARARFHLPLPL